MLLDYNKQKKLVICYLMINSYTVQNIIVQWEMLRVKINLDYETPFHLWNKLLHLYKLLRREGVVWSSKIFEVM